jgi:phage shock protein PspC (stress-responsive transcriptional regulator)
MAVGARARHPRGMSEHITHTPQIKRLERSSSDKVLAGVCGGLGRYFDLSPAVFRLGLVVLTLLGGAGILVYLAAVLVMPGEGAEQSIAEKALAERRDRPWPLVGLGMVAVAIAVLLSRADLWPAAGAGWVLVLIAGLIVLWASRGGHRGIVVGALVTLALVVAAVVTSIVVAFAWFDVSLGDGVGDRTYQPASAAELKRDYHLGVGDLRVDLSQLPRVAKQTPVVASVGIGNLRIVVPRGVPVTVNAKAKAGDVHVLGRQDDGRNAHVRVDSGSPLAIVAKVGAGRIDVVRAK